MNKTLLCGMLFVVALSAQEQTPLNERVMVVYNAANKNSQDVAKYYMAKRDIPKTNICKIDTVEDAFWHAGEFEPEVKKPVRACLEKIGKQKILYIVMSYATPYKFASEGDRYFAVDQFLADIWDEYGKANQSGREAGNNPYYGVAQSQGNAYEPYVSFAAYRARPQAKTIYCVWRLDGASPEIAKGLVDKAMYAEAHGLKGKAYFDETIAAQSQSDTGYGSGNWDIFRASEFAKRAGFEVVLDDKESEFGTAPSLMRCENAAFYAGWYSLQHYNDVFTWVPGAIGFHTDSASATDPRRSNNWAGGALERGITITSGSVTEPFLEGLVHPDQVLLYLFQGANAGDAVVRSTVWLKWMILNLGDPLYRPFPNGAGPYRSMIYHDTWFGIVPSTIVGSGVVQATLRLSESALRPIPVTLKSSNPELVTLPSNGTIPAAGNGGQFPIGVKPGKDPVTTLISVTFGDETISNTLTILPLLMNFTLSQPQVKGGGGVGAVASLYIPAQGDGVKVKFESSSAAVGMPNEVTVAPGQQQARFFVTTKAVSAEQTVTIKATVDGTTKAATLKLHP